MADTEAWKRISNQPQDQFDTDAAIMWAGGHVAAGDMYVFNPQYTVRRRFFSHVLSYPAAGTTNPFTFFGVPEQQFVCDMPGGGNGLPTNSLFMLDGVSFGVCPFLQADGTLIGAGLPGVLGAASPFAWAGELACIYEDGLVNMTIGERNVIENQLGLKFFPEGAGITGPAAGSDPAAAAALAIINNGDANVMNRGCPMDPIVPMLQNKQVKLTAQFQKARPVTVGAACRITARLHGTYITRGTNF